MSFVHFNIPVIVQNTELNGRSNFVLRPLFLSHPVATDRRFEQAVTYFKKEIRRHLNNYHLERENLDYLLWFHFNPKLDFRQFQLTIPIGKQYYRGRFAACIFQLKDKTFISLPQFDNFIFLSAKEQPKSQDLEEELSNVISHLLRNIKNEQGSDFNFDNYCSEGDEFITRIKISLNVLPSSFSFEEDQVPWYFSRVNEQAKFDGAEEIEKVGENLNNLYPGDLKRAFYRDDLVERLSSIIYNRENSPVVILGREGTGKHTILHEAVFRYLENQQSTANDQEELYAKIWHIDPTRIISGMSIIGWWQKRLESIIQFVLNKQKGEHDRLLIDNVVAMLRIGKSSANNMTLSDVIRPYLEKRQIQLILIATPAEWKIMQEKDRRFSDLFQVIRVEEPNLETAARMVLQQKRILEVQQGCEITVQAIHQLFQIQRNYLKRKALPGSVIRLMTQLAAKYRFLTIDSPEVKAEFEVYSGLHEKIFDPTEIFEPEEVRETIGRGLVGQNDAVEALADTVHLIKAKLANPERPLASFLFIGPTGVGKTQAAKVLSQYLTGDEEQLLRFDMNEYIDAGASQRLIGDAFHPEGQLTGQVRYRPFSILLLDEIEKAHPSVHDLLLQVLDDGRLTDSLGRTVDFSNTIIIMTSNVGAREVSAQLGFETTAKDDRAVYRKAVEQQFRPEFINRIDQIVIFNALQLEHILDIAQLQIQELLRRDGFVRRTTILNISREALEWVARRGYDSRMGGRALKRQIEQDLTALSAEQLLKTKGEQPIIFNILLQNDQLWPNIQTLDFVTELRGDWLPDLPEEKKGKGFYLRLLRRVEQIEQRIRQMEEQQTDAPDEVIVIGNQKGEHLDWQYYDFKEKLASVKSEITNLSLGFRDRYFNEGPAIPLRLKTNAILPRNDNNTKGIRENLKDHLFQTEALREINDHYEYATARFSSMETEFINSFLDVQFLEIFTRGFLHGHSEVIKLEFQSLITGTGQQQIDYLVERYSELLKALDIDFKVSKDGRSIRAEGYESSVLLAGEAGIHLFYLSHQNPLPILLKIVRDQQASNHHQTNRVIRLYDEKATLTDLRSGFTNAVNIAATEFKLLLYAGLVEQRQLN